MVDVDTDQQPAEGEVLILTLGGSFCVNGSTPDVLQRIAAEEWPTFELAESGDKVIIRSEQVVALRAGQKGHRRGSIGFAPRTQ